MVHAAIDICYGEVRGDEIGGGALLLLVVDGVFDVADSHRIVFAKCVDDADISVHHIVHLAIFLLVEILQGFEGEVHRL